MAAPPAPQGSTPLQIRRVWGERYRIPLALGMLLFYGVFGLLGDLYLLRGTANWWPNNPFAVAAVVGLPVVVAVGLFLVFLLHAREKTVLSLTTTGIAATTLRGKSVLIRWDDPRLLLFVMINRSRTERPEPVIRWRRKFAPGTAITMESANLLVAWAREHGLQVTEREVPLGRWSTRSFTIQAVKPA
jgi:hypothetical protein